ncbi:MAG: hypothetical protein HY779_00030 [Rubrobacteridae bacterium]|nr:hypothetical protein [Rubrobacteridae bacterium]
MTTSRPYRSALPVEEAMEEILRCAGTQFDPYLANKFLEMFGYGNKFANLRAVESDLQPDDDDVEEAVSF